MQQDQADLDKQTKFDGLKTKVSSEVKKVLDNDIPATAYNHTEAQRLTKSISQKILTKLVEINKKFKFVVNCIIMQKSDTCGLSVDGAMQCNTQVDGTVTEEKDTENYKAIVIVAACYY